MTMILSASTLMRRTVRMTTLVIGIGGLVLAAQQQTALRPVTNQDLVAGLKAPGRWLTFSGDYSGQRHSPLKQLTPQNVAGLVPQWMFQTDVPGLPGRGLENTPLAVDGILYVTGNNNQAPALLKKARRCLKSCVMTRLLASWFLRVREIKLSSRARISASLPDARR